ncbi:MAG TPA: diadenylate cyclase CdaA [Verrucomicrobiota bacterium]|nr:TIGR00159 family protein [Verrucomicrobiales bacterium]HRI13568.1 diadenylate cyclase CdaA [Verrucomicrobiota bacterium]
MTFWWWIQQGWRPALEVLLLAVGIYWAFRFIKGTRGAQMLTGLLALLLFLTIITRVLDLKVLNILLNQFFGVLALALVVIFQPELRRMLAQLGTLPVFVSTRQQRENIEDIVQAADRLSPVRIGALIAIERNQQLAEVVEGGVPINCDLTPEMLETIFFPNNAIHDGGVVVRENRILRAACIFPITNRQDLSKSVGTRHRAAIGLTEETDAVVVVVSEETGAISYAHRGRLTSHVTIEELRAFLTAELVPRLPTRGWAAWIRRWRRTAAEPRVSGPETSA